MIPFEDSEELQAHLDNNEEYISELYGRLEVTTDSNRRSLIEKEIRHRERLSLIYRYLQSHQIPYSQYYDFGSLTNRGYEDNFSFFVFVTTFPIIIMVVGIAVLSALIVTNDFHKSNLQIRFTLQVCPRTKLCCETGVILALFFSCLLIFVGGFAFGWLLYGNSGKYMIMAHTVCLPFGITILLSFPLNFFTWIFIWELSPSYPVFQKQCSFPWSSLHIAFLFLNGYNIFEYQNQDLAIFNVFTSVNIFDVFSVEPVFDSVWKYLGVSFAYLLISGAAGISWFKRKDFC